MPASPRTPVPSSSRMTSVSAWSSAVCPSAIRAAPTRSAAVSSAAWRAARGGGPPPAPPPPPPVREVLLLHPGGGAVGVAGGRAAGGEGAAGGRGRPGEDPRRPADRGRAGGVEYRPAPPPPPPRGDPTADLAHLRLGHGR